MSLLNDTCDGCGARFDPMGDPVLTRTPTAEEPYRVLCASCARPEPVTYTTDSAEALAEALHRVFCDLPDACVCAPGEMLREAQALIASEWMKRHDAEVFDEGRKCGREDPPDVLPHRHPEQVGFVLHEHGHRPHWHDRGGFAYTTDRPNPYRAALAEEGDR